MCIYIGFEISNVATVATKHDTFDDDIERVAFMRHHDWIRVAAAGSKRLNCFFLFFCSTFKAKPEPIIPPGRVQKATPTIQSVVDTILPPNVLGDLSPFKKQKLLIFWYNCCWSNSQK